MATTTGLLSPPRNMMSNCSLYQCRSPKPLPMWPFSKSSYKRHSSSLSLLIDTTSSLLAEHNFGTNSLPSTPFSCKDETRKISDCESGYTDTIPSASSGYCSGSSICSNSSIFSFSPERILSSDEGYSKEQQTVSIPLPSSVAHHTTNIPSSKILSSSAEGRTGNYSNNFPSFSEYAELLKTSPASEDFSSCSLQQSPVSEIDETDGGAFSRLTSVLVASKRSSSESSSSSSGLASPVDDCPRRRVKDDEGFIRRAACVCVNEDETQVVLISSKKGGGGWLVPGGGLECGEGEAEAAVREAWEEAGVTGQVKRCLGIFQSEDSVTHKKKRTAVYVMRVGEQHSTFPEATLGRVREWFSIDTAVGHLSQCKPHQMAYLRAL